MSLSGALTITDAALGNTKAGKNAGKGLSETLTADSVPKGGCPV